MTAREPPSETRARILLCAIWLAACVGGRSPLALGNGTAGSTTLAVSSGGSSGKPGSGGEGSGGAGNGGMSSGGRGEGGSATGGAGGASTSSTSSTTDGGSDTAALNSHDDCVISATVPDAATAGCSLDYDDQLAKPCWPYPPPWGQSVRTGPCGGYLVFATLDQMSMSRCFYDAGARRLVAAHACTDYPAYCDGRAICVWIGPDVGACYDQRPDSLPTQICPVPDSGRD
jgi:hypothetical protein